MILIRVNVFVPVVGPLVRTVVVLIRLPVRLVVPAVMMVYRVIRILVPVRILVIPRIQFLVYAYPKIVRMDNVLMVNASVTIVLV